jgi:hypothetical protein
MAKAIKKAKKPTKKRAAKYEDKLILNGTFEQVMKELITPKTPTKKK